MDVLIIIILLGVLIGIIITMIILYSLMVIAREMVTLNHQFGKLLRLMNPSYHPDTVQGETRIKPMDDTPPPAPPPEPHGINCPNCDRWFPAQAHICPECELPVENMARMSQVKKRFLDGRLTREQYEEVVRKLVG